MEGEENEIETEGNSERSKGKRKESTSEIR